MAFLVLLEPSFNVFGNKNVHLVVLETIKWTFLVLFLRLNLCFYQCKMKKITSFIKSPAPVLTLFKPLLFASTSLIFAMISIVFLAL